MAARKVPQYWREAACIILVSPVSKPTAAAKRYHQNINVLMLQRGKGSSFLPNAHVYPGGVLSEADYDAKGWAKVFSKIPGYKSIQDLAKPFQVPGSRPPMIRNKQFTDAILPPEIAFRICAIRETFEETGVLLTCKQHEVDLAEMASRVKGNIPKLATLGQQFDNKEWRSRISCDASELQELCSEFNVVPNIWALYEWSNWLTPVMFKVTKPPPKPQRYDTMFYVCCLDKQPEKMDLYTDEIAKADWLTPVEWFHLAEEKSILFVGPQIVETCMLSSFTNMKDYLEFVRPREALGCIRWMPVFIRCTDGIVVTLPGDEMYPKCPDYEGTQDPIELDQNVKTVCLQAKKLFRFILRTVQLYNNCNLPCGYPRLTFACKTFPKDYDINKA